MFVCNRGILRGIVNNFLGCVINEILSIDIFYSGPEGARVKVLPPFFLIISCVLNFLNFARLQSLNSD